MIIMRPVYSAKVNFLILNSILGFFLAIACLFTGLKTTLAEDKVEAIAANTQDTKLNGIDRGILAYQSGRYTEAQSLWQDAHNNALIQQNIQAQAQILNYLALTNHKLGDNTTAEEYLAQSLELLSNPACRF